ncbi:hypothetical protein BCAR13_120020 [Paraburkholderia caribensis]|nr:hypothetical protein BCAR13_120020 [Paraburkholderia caribensis]
MIHVLSRCSYGVLITTRVSAAIILSHYRRLYSVEYSAFHIFLAAFFRVYLLFNFR